MVDQIDRAQAAQSLVVGLGHRLQKAYVGQRAEITAGGGEQLLARLGDALCGAAPKAGGQFAVVLEPACKTRDRRQGAEALELRQFALQLFGHALDQEIAERDAAQPGWQLLME
jgi:hypothetical protein